MLLTRLLPALLSVAILALAAPARAGDDDEPVRISREGDLFTITITEASPVEDVIGLIAEEIGADVEGAEAEQETGPMKLVRVTLNQALREIAPKRSYTLKYEDGDDEPSLILFAAAKATPADVAEATDEAPAEGGQSTSRQENPLTGLLKLRGQQPTGKQGDLLNALIAKNPQLQKLKECGELLKLPANRGKNSETLVTAEGEACPPGIRVFGQ